MKQYCLFILLLLIIGCKTEKQKNNKLDNFKLAQSEFNSYQTDSAIYHYKLCTISGHHITDTITFLSYCELAICYQRINAENDLRLTWKMVDSLYKTIPSFKKFQFEYFVDAALIEFNKHNYFNASNYFQKAIALRSPSDTICAFLYYKKGFCYEKRNMMDSAEYNYKKALVISSKKRIRISNENAMYYNVIAYIYLTKYSDFYTAKQYYDSVLFVYKNCQYLDSVSYAWNLFKIGYFYHYLGVSMKAEQFYSLAYNIYSRLINSKDHLMTVLYCQAQLYSDLRKFDIAHNKIDLSIAYYQNESSPIDLQSSYFAKAYIYYNNKDYVQAIKYFNKSQALGYKYHLNNEDRSLETLAWCYLNLNNLDSAEFYFDQCIKIFNNKNNKEINTTISLFGEYSRMLILKKYYKKALETLDNKLPFIIYKLGEKNSLYGYYVYWKALAFENLNKLFVSLEIYNKVILASITPDVKGSFYDVPSFQITDIVSHDNIIDALKAKAGVLIKMSMLKENQQKKIFLLQKSLEHYQKASEVIEDQNKQLNSENDRLQLIQNYSSVSENMLAIAMNLYRITGQNRYLEKAFLAADHGKATQITLGLKDDEYKRLGGIPDSIIQKEKDLQEEIALLQSTLREEKNRNNSGSSHIMQLSNKLNSCMTEAEKLSQQTENNYPRYFQLKFSEKSVDLNLLKKIIGNKKSLIEYAFTKDSLYLFILSDNKITVFNQALSGIEDSLAYFRSMVSKISDSLFDYKYFKRYASLSFWLYRKLLTPVEPVVKDKELVIIPDGLLNLIPFESLTVNDSIPLKTDYGMLHYLLYKNIISYAYSAELFIIQQQARVILSGKVIAFAPEYNNIHLKRHASEDIKSGTIQLAALKGSKEESYSIVKTFGGRAIIGKQATKAYFKRHSHDGSILHLAMHTIIDNENPMYSKLVFTPTNDTGDNAFLNTYEIYNLNLHSPLVVMSACNTGYGKIMKGEGILSMARGFVYAGCPSMVITLWSVADRSSSGLMQNFYRNLRNKEYINKSLRNAKTDYIAGSDQRLSHPYFWAGYIQTGKTVPIFKKTAANLHQMITGALILIIISGLIFYFYRRYKINGNLK